MKYTIVKEFTFEAAHRLVHGYPDKCKYLHGHSWKVRVCLGADELDQYGMAHDFAKVKPIRKWVDEYFDHATIVCDADTKLQQFLMDNEQKFFTVYGNPTSETLAKFIYDLCKTKKLDVQWVEIDETCTSRCRYEPKGE